MAGPIQVIPPGLLGFFQLKTGGRNPTDMSETLQPVLECFDWYMQARGGDYTNDVGVPNRLCNAIGTFGYTNNPIQVPDGEIWWILEYSTRTATLAAAEAITLCPAYLRPLVGTQSLYKLGVSTSAGPGQFCTSYADKQFFLPSGSELGFAVEAIATVGTINVIGSLRYVRCKL